MSTSTPSIYSRFRLRLAPRHTCWAPFDLHGGCWPSLIHLAGTLFPLDLWSIGLPYRYAIKWNRCASVEIFLPNVGWIIGPLNILRLPYLSLWINKIVRYFLCLWCCCYPVICCIHAQYEWRVPSKRFAGTAYFLFPYFCYYLEMTSILELGSRTGGEISCLI